MNRSIMAIAMAIALFGCNSEKKSRMENADITTDTISLPANKIIKTADIRFRVKDARKMKTEISRQIKNYGGSLVESVIESNIEQTEKIKYSADSVLEIMSYHTEGNITARIPSEKLDDFTDDVVNQASFVHHQSLKFDDQRVSYLSNTLHAKNRAETINSVKKTDKKINDAEKLLALKDAYTDQKTENLLIDDKVKYSTITLNFYQENTVKKLVAGNDNISDYRPGFFNRLGLNLLVGWDVCKEFILVLATLWAPLLAGVAIYLAIRQYKNNRKLKTV